MMREIQLKTGTAIIPEEWFLVPTKTSGEEDYIVAIEMRGGGFPTFYFPSESPDISQEKQYEICRAITKDHAWFQDEVLDMQVETVWQNGKWVNEDKWAAAPIIGFFTVPDAGLAYEMYPYGAHIVRTADRSPEE